MNVYFACSITGGRGDEAIYQTIVDALINDGHEVPTAHLSSPDVVSLEHVVDPVEVYTRDIEWTKASDAVIAEVSTPSHGVGYEVAYALMAAKPVLCCHRHDVKVSKMITGNTSRGLAVRSFKTRDEAGQIVRKFMEEANKKGG